MDGNKRKEFEDAVWIRMKELIKEKGIKQSQLVQKCKEIGMPVTQPELSKLYSGTKKINLYELTAISKALGVPVDFFVSDFVSGQEDLLYSRESKKLISQANDEAFLSYFGEYYIYYNTTAEQEDKVQCGKMVISKEKEGYCKVELSIHTGAYQGKKELVKKYKGRMVLTALLSGAYIVLKSDSIGELCFMVMRHRTFTVKQITCRMALCLTIGAGESKLPTSHRMLISRNKLLDEQIQIIQPYFDLYGNVIRIEKNKVKELEDGLEAEAEKEELRALWRVLPEKQYYEISVELLRRHLHLDREKFAVFIASLLKLADTEPYSKIYEADDNLTYAIIENLTDNKNGIPPDNTK